jgi:hypothetical protein
MHLTVRALLYLLAFICFLIATFNLPLVRINLIALGLALLTLTLLMYPG